MLPRGAVVGIPVSAGSMRRCFGPLLGLPFIPSFGSSIMAKYVLLSTIFRRLRALGDFQLGRARHLDTRNGSGFLPSSSTLPLRSGGVMPTFQMDKRAHATE